MNGENNMDFLKGLGLIIIVFLSSCAEFIQPSYGPTENFNVKNMSGDEINISTALYIENLNKYGFRVKTKNMALYVDDKKVADVKISNRVKIKKNTAQEYPFDIQIKLEKGTSLLALGAGSMFANKPINVAIRGKIKGKKFIFGKSVPIDYQKKVNPRQLMNLKGNGLGF